MTDEWMLRMQQCEKCDEGVVFIVDILRWVTATKGNPSCHGSLHVVSKEAALAREREIAIKQAKYPGRPYTIPML